jgi:hypothetical protein
MRPKLIYPHSMARTNEFKTAFFKIRYEGAFALYESALEALETAGLEILLERAVASAERRRFDLLLDLEVDWNKTSTQ